MNSFCVADLFSLLCSLVFLFLFWLSTLSSAFFALCRSGGLNPQLGFGQSAAAAFCRGFALGDHNSGKFPTRQRGSTTWQQQQLHHVSVSEGKMTSPTSDTTSRPQRQRGRDSTEDPKLGKLMGARTNTHSTTSTNQVTAVFANLDTAELGYDNPLAAGYLHACMHPNSGRARQVASTSQPIAK